MKAWMISLVVLAGCEVVGAGTSPLQTGSPAAEAPGVAPPAPGTTPPAPAPIAGGRLPASTGASGALGPAQERCLGGDDRPIACGGSGGRSGARRCVEQRWGRSELRPLTDRPTFASDGDLFPGAVIQGKRFAAGEVALVAPARAGGRISVGPAARDVPAVTRAEVETAVAPLLAAPPAAATRSVVAVEAHSAEQLLFELGADGRQEPGLLVALELTPSAANEVVLVVTDRLATASFQPPPGDPLAVFRDGARLPDPEGTIASDNPPLYVASVTYGRQLLVAARSPAPVEPLQTALEGAARGAPPDTKTAAGPTFQATLAGATWKAATRGGALPLPDVPPGERYEALRRLLAGVPPVTAAVPIAYTLRYLLDGAPATMAFSATYPQVRCTPLPDRPFAIVLSGANIDKDMYVWMEAGSGNELVFYSSERQGGSVNLSEALNRHGATEAVIEVKLGNFDCFHASGSLAVVVDGTPRWRADLDRGLADCGWQLEAKLRVNQATGKVEELMRR